MTDAASDAQSALDRLIVENRDKKASLDAALANDAEDAEKIRTLTEALAASEKLSEWRETSRKTYIPAHNAAVKALGMPLPNPKGGVAYTPEEIQAAAKASQGQSAEVAALKEELRLEREKVASLLEAQSKADVLQNDLKKVMKDKGMKLP